MNNGEKRVTLNDVAKVAGVSASTISRALKDDPRISLEVIQKVKKISSELGYVPNITARSLKTGRSQIIGLLVRDINDEWSAAVIPAVEKECSNFKYALLLSNSDSDLNREQYYLNVLKQRNVEGVLILTPLSSDQESYLKIADEIPMVLVDTYLSEPKLNAITVDHELGSYISTSHLLDLGHRETAFISGPLNISPSRQYRHGYYRALSERGILDDKRLFVEEKRIDVEHGYRAMQKILEKYPGITAVATGSDLMAAGAMKAVKDGGLAIPDDISIVGYDDIPMSSFLSPALTTIRQDRGVLGRLAVEMLMGVIEGNSINPKQITIPPEFVLRESTSQPKKRMTFY